MNKIDSRLNVFVTTGDPVMRKLALFSLFVLLTVPGINVANAAGSSSDTSVSIGDVKREVDRGKYDRAIKKAEDYLESSPQSADAYNYIGYSRRQLGQYAQAEAAYIKALKIDPSHVGAHEYYGELYIKLGNIKSAEKHLADLSRICGNCEEQQMLAKKIGDAKSSR